MRQPCDAAKEAWSAPGAESVTEGTMAEVDTVGLTGGDASTAAPIRDAYIPRFLQQFKALMRKNFILSWRNRRGTILQLMTPFFFIFLVYVIDLSIQADQQEETFLKEIRDPTPRVVTAIPPCEDDKYARAPCWDFLYTFDPVDDPDIAEIVRLMRVHNEGREIPAEKVLGFTQPALAEEWMLKNFDKSLGAVHFRWEDAARKKLLFDLQTNSTVKFFKGSFQDPNMFAQLPLQTAVERAAIRFLRARDGTGDFTGDIEFETRVREFPHPAQASESVVAIIAASFLFAAAMFGFVLQLSAVVGERENKLRRALTAMGMLDSAYWLSWLAWELALVFTGSLLICIFGCMFQFDLFLNNDFGLMLCVFFMFEAALLCMAFTISTFIRKVITATNIGFMVFLLGWIFQIVTIFGFPYSPDYFAESGYIYTVIFSLMPWNLLMKSIQDLGAATAQSTSPGLSWGDRYSYCVDANIKDMTPEERNDFFAPFEGKYLDENCVMPVGKCLEALAGLAFGYFFLALYLDNILPNEDGMRRAPWYFLMPSYWGVSRDFTIAAPDLVAESASKTTIDEDVAAEEERLKALRQGHVDSHSTSQVENGTAVEVLGLSKRFKKFNAIKGSWFGINQDELFCLLGPNGAGKTTTINCLTGSLNPTAGDALVNGYSLTSSGGMDQIRSEMGVCPQFDVLWETLTGRDHLIIYGLVKGIAPHLVGPEADRLLAATKLTDAAELRTSGYSGGMKRRLSVAIALLGNPRVVYLDEPTTGMDPISRRHVWDIIEAAKKGRAIVLTTHSMEEADILGDRIAIMCRGQIRCIGSSLRLKTRFGAGYRLSICLALEEEAGGSVYQESGAEADQIRARAESMRALFRDRLQVTEAEENRAYIHFLVPREKEGELPGFLASLEDEMTRLGLTDLKLSLATLEEVFLSIAAKAEAEHVQMSGKAVKPERLILEDGTWLDVPPGAEYVMHPASQKVYKIKWAQDEYGALQLVDHEEYKPPASSSTAYAAEPAGIGSGGVPNVPPAV